MSEDKDKVSGDPRYHALLREMAELHNKKSADYGLGADFLANVRASYKGRRGQGEGAATTECE